MSDTKTIYDFHEWAGDQCGWRQTAHPVREWFEHLEVLYGRVDIQMHRFLEFNVLWEGQPDDQKRWMHVYDILCDMLGEES